MPLHEQQKALPKRFYTEVEKREVDGQYEILLDGRVVKTMARNTLRLPNETLAHAVAEEWAAQLTHVDANSMPLTRIANIAIDRVPTDRAAILADIMLYAETDLLCHRAPDEELRALQEAQWDPILAWLKETHRIEMKVTTGVIPREQPAESIAAIRALLEQTSNTSFAALAMLVPLLGSVLLAIALWKKAVTLDNALTASRLDEDYQSARWGKDAEADALWAYKAQDLQACTRWLHSVTD